MNTYKKGQLLILVLVLCCSWLEAADEPPASKDGLRFIVSDELKKLDNSWSPYLPMRTTHMAVFRLKRVRNWGKFDLININIRTNVNLKGDVKFHFWEWAQDSPTFFHLFLPNGKPKGPVDRINVIEMDDEEEMELALYGEYEKGRVGEKQSETMVNEIWVCAKSEEEARDNAKTVINLIRQLAYAPLEKSERELILLRERIEKLETEIPELERKKKELKREIEEHKKTVHYRRETDARRSILEWMDMLSAIEVDLVGIKARLAKIKEIMDRGKYLPSVLEMQIATEVDLAGALARKDAAQSFRQKAIDFVTLVHVTYRKVSRSLKSKQDELVHSRYLVAGYEKVLANLRAANIQPVEVVDNVVTIYPVK